MGEGRVGGLGAEEGGGGEGWGVGAEEGGGGLGGWGQRRVREGRVGGM